MYVLHKTDALNEDEQMQTNKVFLIIASICCRDKDFSLNIIFIH